VTCGYLARCDRPAEPFLKKEIREPVGHIANVFSAERQKFFQRFINCRFQIADGQEWTEARERLLGEMGTYLPTLVGKYLDVVLALGLGATNQRIFSPAMFSRFRKPELWPAAIMQHFLKGGQVGSIRVHPSRAYAAY
jgi:hypothetical protein